MIRNIEDHTDFEKEQWGSHKEVIIDHIMKEDKINFMIELGSGEFSTPVYAPLVDHLISIETSEEWMNFMKNKHPIDNVEYILMHESKIPQYIEDLFVKDVNPDLVLVDHTHESIPNQRMEVASQLMHKGCKHIVLHDINQDMLDKIENNEAYEYFINTKSINPSLWLRRK